METFVARQPIFDRSQHVIAYELLFRSGPVDYFNGLDGDAASSSVISDTLQVFGFRELTGGKKAFINVSRNILIDGFPLLLPSDTTVVELLETIEPDKAVVDACRHLKDARYTLALDDFVFSPGYEALIPLVDIIKIDFLATDRDEREALYRRFSPRGIRFLAEKVETREQFDEAWALGYDYFQGYFICRPQLMSRKALSAASRSALNLIQEINRSDLDHMALERTIQQDAALTLKLLRYLNSAYFALPSRITSIMHALTLLGDSPVRRWASMVALGTLAHGKPGELRLTSLVRARFCETAGALIAGEFQGNELFMMGMISTFDALLDTPMREVLAEMSIAERVVAALISGTGPLGHLYALTGSLERGEWPEASAQGRQIGLSDADSARLYREAVIWADRVQLTA